MANPTPEILPEDALAVRPDAILGTGRSDYPNQVNNVLCFPFIFRGALDVGATTINEEMKLAAVRAIAELAHAEIPDVVAQAYGTAGLRFGADYLIPKPFDPRLIEVVAPAVALAAMDSGVASRPIADMPAYRQRLSQFVYQSGAAMQPVFAAAKRLFQRTPRRVVFAEGEDERVLRAAQVVVDEGLALPLLVGRPAVIAERIAQYRPAPEGRPRLRVRRPARRRGLRQCGRRLLPDRPAKRRLASGGAAEMRSRSTLLGAMLVRQGKADAMLCGTLGRFADHLGVTWPT